VIGPAGGIDIALLDARVAVHPDAESPSGEATSRHDGSLHPRQPAG
jgi:hypothetical protein